MITVDKTDVFIRWLKKLKDRRAKILIASHIDRIECGNFGKVEPVGDGVYEKKINYGPGYRLYYCKKGDDWIVLLCGGDKSNQQSDIDQAKELKKGL